MIIPREVVVDTALATRRAVLPKEYENEPWIESIRFANDIAEYVQANPEWIKCSERMPELGQDVLVFEQLNKSYWIAHIDPIVNSEWIVNDTWYADGESVRDDVNKESQYWMPLPCPPKGD